MALGPFTMTPQRETVCDMSFPLSVENKAVLVPRPKVKTDVAGFLKAFTVEVSLMICMLSVSTQLNHYSSSHLLAVFAFLGMDTLPSS